MSGTDSGAPRGPLTHINLARGWRGGERQTELLITELARRGWQQQFIGRRGGELAERLAGITGLTITTAGSAITGAWRVGSSLIHTHEARAAQAAWLATRFGPRRYVVTRRVTNRPSGSRITKRVYHDADAVCAISESVAAVLRDRFPAIAPVVVPDGWAAATADPAEVARIRDRLRGSFLVGCVAALEASKGIPVLIEAARRMLPEHPGMAFVVIGDGRDAHAFQSAARGVEGLTFTGFVRNVADYLACMDIFVLPSLQEGLGSSVLEAMAQEVPVIASATGGLTELVIDDVTGLLVAPGDAESLASGIAELAGDPARRRRLADEARRRIGNLHAEKMADRYEKLYAAVSATVDGDAQRSSERPA